MDHFQVGQSIERIYGQRQHVTDSVGYLMAPQVRHSNSTDQ
jgi:hypothetical protein